MISSKRPYLARQRGGGGRAGGRVSRSLCRRSRSDQHLCFFSFLVLTGLSEALFLPLHARRAYLSLWQGFSCPGKGVCGYPAVR